MTSLLGNLFPKKSINEPSLDLNDPRWKELEGGYRGSYCDASVPLRRLEQATTITEANEIYKELWDELHHQGDIAGKSLLRFYPAMSLLLNWSSKAAILLFIGLLYFDSFSFSIIERAILAMIL